MITAARDDSALSVAQTMRDRGVGSVVVTDAEGEPAGIVTDRDLALRVLAEDRAPADAPIGDCATTPLITRRARDGPRGGRRADGPPPGPPPARSSRSGRLAGIVTLDDIAVRTGNLEVAQRMTAEVIEGALPDFFFHERG